jgi:hypothetical protein
MLLIVLLITNRSWAGAIAAFSFAFSFSEWSQATIAEIYTLNSLLIALSVLSLLLWQQGKARLEIFAFLFGLSQAHHRTSVLLGIPFAVFILLHNRAIVKRPKFILRLFIIALISQIAYVYLIIRGNWISYQYLLEYMVNGSVRIWFRWPSGLAEYFQRI